MGNSDELVHYRLTEVEEKVKVIDDKLARTVINLEVMKTELSQATGKQSTVISSVVSVIVGVVIFSLNEVVK